MDWLRNMHAAIDYIEAHLDGEIDLADVARQAMCSSYNFQRMFSFITDTTLAEYIRRRRLTMAAQDLRATSARVIDIALKYGYDSPAAFAKAFQGVHGVTPSQARGEGVPLKAYPKLSFQITIKGATAMDYRIETKPAFDIFGIETISSTTGDPAYEKPSALWNRCQKDGSHDALEAAAGSLPQWLPQDLCRVHGACGHVKTDGSNTFSYMLFAFKGPESKAEGYASAHIPSTTYAVFPTGRFEWKDVTTTITALNKRIFAEWEPAGDYAIAEGPDFELYGGTGDYGYVELWYPVKKKD